MGCARYRAHLAGTTPCFEHEYRLRTPRGWIWLLDRGRIVERDADDRPLRIAGTTTDLSARKALEESFVEALNQQQRRLSRELHEGLAQHLTGAALLVASVSKELEPDQPAAAAQLDKVLTELKAAIEETRSLVRGLLPASIERGELGLALRALEGAGTLKDSVRVTCDVTEWDSRPLTAPIAQHVYAIIQQVILNARHYPAIKTIAITLKADADYLILLISHQTPECTPACQEADRLCASILAYRAQVLGGTLSEEHLAQATRIRLRCPARIGHEGSPFTTRTGRCDCIPHDDSSKPMIRRK